MQPAGPQRLQVRIVLDPSLPHVQKGLIRCLTQLQPLLWYTHRQLMMAVASPCRAVSRVC